MTTYFVSYFFGLENGHGFGGLAVNSPTKPPTVKFLDDLRDKLLKESNKNLTGVAILSFNEVLYDPKAVTDI